jgi:type IV pilus assembly protein PilB
MDIGIDPFLISSTVAAVLTQRLVRVLCPHCRQPFTPRHEMMASFLIEPHGVEAYAFYQPKGCLHCNGTGFKGRVALHELLVINDPIREAVVAHQTSSQIRLIAREKANLVSMREDGFYKATQGVTTLEEVIRVVFSHESDVAAPRTAEQVIALCEGREVLKLPIHPAVVDKVPLEKVSVQVFTSDEAAQALEGESYRIRFEANTIESETERIADFFEAYRRIKERLGQDVSGEYLGDFVDFVIDTVKRLRATEGAEFAEFSLHVREQKDRIFVETLLPHREPPGPPRSTREAGLRQVGYLK